MLFGNRVSYPVQRRLASPITSRIRLTELAWPRAFPLRGAPARAF